MTTENQLFQTNKYQNDLCGLQKIITTTSIKTVTTVTQRVSTIINNNIETTLNKNMGQKSNDTSKNTS